MARLAAILRALNLVLWRDRKSVFSLVGNNLFIVSVLVMQGAGAFIYMIAGVVVLLPLSADPLGKIPASRLNLLPLDRRERWLLRAASPWVNPMTWAIAVLAVWMVRGRVTVGLWGLSAGMVAVGFALSWLPSAMRYGTWRRLPNFPGALNQLIRKNLREMLSTLDFYCALLLSTSALAVRLATGALPVEALMGVTVLVIIALSSYAQSLFGLDGAGGLSRYRLLPLPGWKVLLAKDAAFLMVAAALTTALAPLAGLSAAFVALSIGHHKTVCAPRVQMRWRFSAREMSLPEVLLALVEASVLFLAASSVCYHSPLFLIPCLATWAGSLWWYGRAFERVNDRTSPRMRGSGRAGNQPNIRPAGL